LTGCKATACCLLYGCAVASGSTLPIRPPATTNRTTLAASACSAALPRLPVKKSTASCTLHRQWDDKLTV
jgi:hypothetical protein